MSAPDDRHPESGDASHFDFDELVLDEEFVRGATISEASATARMERKREQHVRRSSRFPRPQLRRLRRGFHHWNRAPRHDRRTRPAPDAPKLREWTAAQWTAVIVVLALAGAFVWSLTKSGSSAHTAVSPAPTSVSTPASADAKGTCFSSVTNHVASGKVSCELPHVVEVTGYAQTPNLPLTASAQSAIDTTCRQEALIYAGQPVADVKSSYLLPNATQTRAGDRYAECTIFQADRSGAPVPITATLGGSGY